MNVMYMMRAWYVCVFSQDDGEGQLVALHVLNEMLNKLPGAFEEQFARLGLPMHIANLAGTASEGEQANEASEEKPKEQLGEQQDGAKMEEVDGAQATPVSVQDMYMCVYVCM